MRFVRGILLLAVIAPPSAVFAHEGEDHGELAVSASAGAGAGGRRAAYGQTGAFELLIKHAPGVEGKDASLTVFLADYATNAPIEKAKIELELAAPKPVKAAAEPTGSPGIYHAAAKIPPGRYPLIATIEAGERLDLVEIKEVDLSAAPRTVTIGAHAHVPWLLIGVIAGAVLLAIMALIVVRKRLWRRSASTAVAVLLLGLAPLAARGHGPEEHGTPSPEPTGKAAPGAIFLAKESQFLLGIRTSVAGERDVESRLATVGQVIPRIDGHAEIYPPLPGRILPVAGKLPFLGDRVTRGQKLLVIQQTLAAAESGELQAQAIRARTAVAEARAQRDQRKRDLERLRSLAGVVAAKDIQQAELDLQLAEQALQRAGQEAALFGGGQLQQIMVTAPIDGVIAEADVAVGEQVAPEKKLFTIIDSSTLWVEAEVFESDLQRLEGAGSAAIRVEGYDTVFAGSLFRMGQVVSPATRTVKAIFAVPNPDGRLRSGMFADVAIGAGGRTRSLVVPDDAVVEEGGRRFVFVHTTPEEFVRREVVLGARDGDVWAVRSGLEKGERVVVQGTYQLRTAR